MKLKIDKRLKTVADNVPFCKTAADIGTDHALIPVYLILNGICAEAIASDLKKGPLDAARRNIEKYGLQQFIKTRLGNGLDVIEEGEAETVIIAGMGGVLITNILENDIRKSKSIKNFVLQPNYATEYLRKWLYNNGFDIYDEDLAKEGRKFYNILKVRPNGEPRQKSDLEYIVGENLIAKKHVLFSEYIEYLIKIYTKIENGLSKSKSKSERINKELQTTINIRKELEELLYQEVVDKKG